MRTEEFPNCCTALVLTDFGQTELSGYGNHPVNAVSLEKEIRETIDNTEEIYAVLVATTNSQQKVANKVLKKIGFKGTEQMSKGQHKTKLTLWWYPLRGTNENRD